MSAGDYINNGDLWQRQCAESIDAARTLWIGTISVVNDPGVANNLTGTATVPIHRLITGSKLRGVLSGSMVGGDPSTLAIKKPDGTTAISATSLKRADGSTAVDKGYELVTGNLVEFWYDGTNFRLFYSNGLIEPPLASWSPSYGASGSMTFGTVTTHRARYRYDLSSNTVSGHIHATGTTGGTASTDLTFTLPINAAASTIVSGGACGFTGGTRVCAFYSNVSGAGTVTVSRYDLGNWALAANTGFSLSFFYQAA